MGDWRCSWPTPVALWSSVGGTFLLPLFSSLAPGFWDSVPDSVYSGHAHGGQIRIPVVGAIAAPNQGFFPKYADGIHKENNTTMIISNGIGSSLIPIRVFAQPELIVTEFK